MVKLKKRENKKSGGKADFPPATGKKSRQRTNKPKMWGEIYKFFQRGELRTYLNYVSRILSQNTQSFISAKFPLCLHSIGKEKEEGK